MKAYIFKCFLNAIGAGIWTLSFAAVCKFYGSVPPTWACVMVYTIGVQGAWAHTKEAQL